MDEGLTRNINLFSNEIYILEKIVTKDLCNDSFYLCRKDFKSLENTDSEFEQVYREYIFDLYNINLENVENYSIKFSDDRVALINIPLFKIKIKKKIFDYKLFSKSRA